MPKYPAELSDADLAEIAFKVRNRLEKKFGSTIVRVILTKYPSFSRDLIRETYIAVREKLENETNN